jgi:small subunit ribosomal protein S18
MAFIKKPEAHLKSQKFSADNQAQVRASGKFKKSGLLRKKICRFCADKIEADYKNVSLLRSFITEKGKILSGRITGTCARHQRKLDKSIKRARMLALLPFKAD